MFKVWSFALNIVYAFMYIVDAATKCMNVRESRLAKMVCAGGVDPAKQRNQYVPIIFSPSQSRRCDSGSSSLSGGPENIRSLQLPVRQR